MRNYLALILSLVCLSAFSQPSMKFLLHGKPHRTLSLAEMEKITKSQTLTLQEPHIKSPKTYKVVNLNKILDAVYGKSWKKGPILSTMCKDGFQPQINTKKLLKYGAYLAYAETNTKDFKIKKPAENNRIVELAPFYMVWDNLKHKDLLDEPTMQDWPYQLTQIDVK